MIRWIPFLAILAVGAAGQDTPPDVTHLGAGVTSPRVLQKTEPEYSEEARVAGLSGMVTLQLVVGEDGTPRDIKVTKPLGLGLDEQAISAVSKWRFAPGMKDGRAVPVSTQIQVNFALTTASGWHLNAAVCKPPEHVSRPTVMHSDYPGPRPAPGENVSVAVSFDVDETGVPVNLHVEKSSDEKWEKDVVASMRGWKFHPGAGDAGAVAVRCTWEFVSRPSGVMGGAMGSLPPLPPPTPVDPARLAAAEELYPLLKFEQMVRRIMEQYRPGLTAPLEKGLADQLPKSVDRAKIAAESREFGNRLFPAMFDRMDFAKVKTAIVKAYSETFTAEELKAFATFYESPAGQAFAQKEPILMARINVVSADMVRDAIPEVTKMSKEWIESMKKKYGDPASMPPPK